MITAKDLIDIFFEMLKRCIESITLPTGNNLVPTFLYSLLVLVASIISRILVPKFTFVDWRGALVATILLLILAIIERRGVSEVSRLYRVVKSGTTAVKERAKRSGAAIKARRGADTGDEMHEEVIGPTDGRGEM